jgi:hypothetical protein
MAAVLAWGMAAARAEPVEAEVRKSPDTKNKNADGRSDRPQARGSTAGDPAAGGDAADRSWGELEGDAGLGFLGPDLLTTLQVGFDLQEGGFTLGIQARLRLRIADRGAQREGLGVRQEDWDEPSDLAYLLRYASYRKRIGEVGLGISLGELAGYTLGHGTLIRNYHSAVDLDHPHSGIAARVGAPRWQVDLVLDDFVAPELAGLRVAGVPLRSGSHALVIGVSSLLDFRAPQEALLDEQGHRLLDEHRNLELRRALLGGVGIDVAYELGDPADPAADHLRLYVDGNLLVPERGVAPLALGLHLGASFQVHPFGGKLALFGGLEYRRLGPGYLPAWVDLVYDVQRQQLPLTRRALDALEGQVPTKLGALADGLLEAGNAWRGELGVRFAPWLQLAAHYDHRPGLVGKALGARTTVLVGRRFLAAALVERFGFLTGEDLGRGPGLLVAAEARYRPLRNLYVLAQYSRLMRLGDGGLYRPLDQLNVAVGGAWGY